MQRRCLSQCQRKDGKGEGCYGAGLRGWNSRHNCSQVTMLAQLKISMPGIDSFKRGVLMGK